MIRTARQIRVDSKLLSNKNVNVKIGTVENRNNPETIYIEVAFWIKPKDVEEDGKTLKKRLYKDLKNIYTENLSKILKDNKIFPKFDDNIYIANVPESVNYNNKKNFVSIEIYLHTINILSSNEKYPLTKKKDSEIFTESLKVIDSMVNADIMLSNGDFFICKKK